MNVQSVGFCARTERSKERKMIQIQIPVSLRLKNELVTIRSFLCGETPTAPSPAVKATDSGDLLKNYGLTSDGQAAKLFVVLLLGGAFQDFTQERTMHDVGQTESGVTAALVAAAPKTIAMDGLALW